MRLQPGDGDDDLGRGPRPRRARPPAQGVDQMNAALPTADLLLLIAVLISAALLVLALIRAEDPAAV